MQHNVTMATVQPLNADIEGLSLGVNEGCGVFLSFGRAGRTIPFSLARASNSKQTEWECASSSLCCL